MLELKEQENIILVMPPKIFTDKNYVPKNTYYQPLRAVYGFRRLPRLWGPPSVALRLRKLYPMEAEPNLWRILREEEGGTEEELEKDDPKDLQKLEGLVMTYVDDIFVTGPKSVVQAVVAKIRDTWSTSEPEVVSEVPVRFLGMEVRKEINSQTGRESWFLSQEGYIKDLLEKQDEKEPARKAPITKDQSYMEDPPSEAQH